MSLATVSMIQAAIAGPKAVTDTHHLPSPSPSLDFPHSCPARQLVYPNRLPDWVIDTPGAGLKLSVELLLLSCNCCHCKTIALPGMETLGAIPVNPWGSAIQKEQSRLFDVLRIF